MKNRAYSTLEIRSAEVVGDDRIIEGIASTISVDSHKTTIDPAGVQFKLPLPLLLHHDHEKPVGEVFEAKVTNRGVEFKAKIFKAEESSKLKERLDEAWESVKIGLIRGVSVGFSSVEVEKRKGVVAHFKKWLWRELSLVTIPSNSDATIENIRSADEKFLEASSCKKSRKTVNFACVRATNFNLINGESNMNLKEQLAAAQAKLASENAKLSDILDRAAKDGNRSLNESEAEAFDECEATIEEVKTHIRRLETAIKAAVVEKEEDAKNAKKVEERSFKDGVVISDKVDAASIFTRSAMCLALAGGNKYGAVDVAKNMFADVPEVADYCRAAVTPGMTTSGNWAEALVDKNNPSQAFLELVRPLTAVDKMNQLVKVAFNVSVPVQTAASSATWVGEGQVKPMSNPVFSNVVLTHNTLALITPVSKQLVKLGRADSISMIQNDMVKAIAKGMDESFLNPLSTEIAGIRPASVTAGAFNFAASGTDAAAVRADLGVLMQGSLVDGDLSGLVYVMKSGVAYNLSRMRNALGQREFPELTLNGGFIDGIPVIVSNTLSSDSSGDIIVLINQKDILFADEGITDIAISDQASAQFNTTPDNPATGSTVYRSAFQENLYLIRVERMMTWKRARTTGAAYITGVNYR